MAKNPKKVETTAPQTGLSAEQLEALVVSNARLLNAVLSEGAPKSQSASATHVVENNVIMEIFMRVTDLKSAGGFRVLHLPNKGATAKITLDEAEELASTYPEHVTRGWISLPGVVADNSNVIKDMDAFIAGLSFQTFEATIDAIDDVSVLYQIYHAIENRRFTSVDANGRDLTEPDEKGGEVKVMREIKIPSILLATEVMVQRRILDLSGVKASLDA